MSRNSRRARRPFVTAENIANATQKVTKTLGVESAGMFFQPPDRVASTKAEPEPSADPAFAAAQAQIEIVWQAAAADAILILPPMITAWTSVRAH